MKLGGIRREKKNKPAEETQESLQTEKKARKKLSLPSLDRESLEKLMNGLLKPRGRKKRKKRRISISARKLIEIILILLSCYILISPLSYWVVSDEDFVSRAAAEEIGFADSGVTADKTDWLKCDMIKLNGRACYKIEFESGINGYKYIVDAGTGEIIAQAYYQIEKAEEPEAES